MNKIIELKNVTKRFGGITALNSASLHVNKGEVVGLIGDNGAGKSTLIKTLVGVYSPDDGDIYIKGEKVVNWSSLKARISGIETVFQDRALCPQQSIVWNIFMGKELTYPFGLIKEKKQIAERFQKRFPIGICIYNCYTLYIESLGVAKCNTAPTVL